MEECKTSKWILDKRYADIEEQLRKRKMSASKIGLGAMYFIMGLAKKVILANTAGEVFEHFYNPLHFISEVSRVLKVGGRLVLTTPNLSYFGNVCRLLNGKSVFEELERSHIFYHSEWRPHERVYTAEELNSLMKRGKLKNRMVCYIDNHYETYQKRTLSMFLHQSFIRMFYFIPRFRPQYIGVFEKES